MQELRRCHQSSDNWLDEGGMSGICGWIGSAMAPEQAGSVLTDMLGSVNGNDLAADKSISVNAGAIATRPGIIPVSMHQAGALVVAVQGRAHWDSPNLTTLAAQRGCAAALAEAYRRHGNDCLLHIGGPCAIAIVDTDSASGLLAVDRMGIRTMCYANPPGQLVFGSTADAVSAHPKVGSQLSHQAIFNYLYCHVVPSPGTIYQAIQKLRPGECLTFRKGAVDKRFYWQLRYDDDDGRESFDALADRFQRLLREAAGRAIAGDANIGTFLSGGTDSSTVTGLLSELCGKPPKTYSIGFAADGFDEMEYARITARHFAADAHEYYVTPQDVVDAIPLIAQAYDEPFGNSSAVPTYFCARMARADGVRVMLAGDGGDEIFGGNVRYAKQKVFESYWSIPGPLRRALIEPLTLGLPGGDRIPLLRKLRSYIRQASVPLPDRLESYNFLNRSPLADVLEPGFLVDVDVIQPLALLREVYQRTASASPVNRMMHLDLKFTLADNDLRKVSRMCELAGVEVRYPLLDEALVEFSGEIPVSLKVKGVKLRYFFKQALRDFLPAETLAKTKHGFGMPFGLWLRDHKFLADFANESLDAFQHRGIVKPSYIRELQQQHETTHATYFGVMIWVIITLERWLAARKL
jgi:asparagine synthase (glutamine-hydrolysing)